jgi:DNA-binding SARP family transcriptional activator
MQSALTAGGVDPCLLLIEAEWIGINPEINLWLDVAEFEVAAGLLGKSLAKQFAPTTLQKIEAALQVYRGNLLEGWYNDWCLFERERLQDLYLTMLSRLLDDAELRGDYEKGILYGEKILSYDNAHERTHQRLMRLRYLTGDRTAALRQFERCEVALQRDLDVKPSQETLDMCTWLRSDGGKGLVSANPPPAASPELLTLFHMMHQVHNLMDELQSQIQRYLTGEIATAHSLDVSPIYDGEPDV